MGEIGLHKTELDTPVLWVDLDRLDSNIETLAKHFQRAGVNWRPHVKGIKVPAIAHKVLKAGAIGLTCAKLGEAEVMAAAGVEDLLIANQVVGPKKIARLVNLRRQVDVKVLVDNQANVVELGRAATAKGVELGVLVEVNTGMDRAGVAPGQPVVDLACRANETPGLRFLGVMTWEGHALRFEDVEQKRQAIEEAISALTDSAQLCRDAGLSVPIVSCGGSGTYRVTPFLPGITEIEAGGAIFCDATYQRWGVETDPALFVRSIVTSRPASDRIIFDVGFKALPRWIGPGKPVGLSGVKSIAMSAEHGIVTLDGPNEQVQIGDVFDFIVGYGDSTVFLYDYLYGIREEVVEAIWPIQARGKLQ